MHTILEYALNELLLHVHPTDLLIVKNWMETFLIKDPATGNIEKLMLIPLPNFDQETFPFVLSGPAII